MGDFVEAGSTCTALVTFLVGLPVALLLSILLAVWWSRNSGRTVILAIDALIVAVPLALGILPSDFVGFVITASAVAGFVVLFWAGRAPRAV
jgi:peptidoglycan biosynthesis protein MviN/MurJ (putative lipid II flippase)